MADPQNILFIQLGDIGDVVLTLPCIRALRETFPASRIYAAVHDRAADLLRLCPHLDGIIPISLKKRPLLDNIAHQCRFFRDLRRKKIDLAIEMRTGDRGAILAFMSGARRRIACYASDGLLWRNRLFTDLYREDYHSDTHVTRYQLDFLAAYGITTAYPTPEISIPSDAAGEAEKLLAAAKVPGASKLIAVQPFSLWQYKELAAEKYVALILHLRDTYGVSVLVTGAPSEKERAGAIANACGAGVFNLAGRTSLSQYAAMLSRCSLFIGVDSVGQHLAAAVGTPTVTIYGPSKPASWAPTGERHLVIQSDLDCVPCRLTGCNSSGQSKCLALLSADAIIAATDRHYQSLKPRP